MQFGPSLDKRNLQHLVRDTPWNGFLELNRLAFDERLPRNSESRALGVAFRMIRTQYPHVQWIVSFADGTQCGDGTIYRAAGFVLTSIKKNTTIWEMSGHTVTKVTATDHTSACGLNALVRATESVRATNISLRKNPDRVNAVTKKKGSHICLNGSASMDRFKEMGFKPMVGFQLRYIYFLDPTARARLTCPEIPFSQIEALGASMYLGKARGKQAMAEVPSVQRRGSGDPHAPDERKRRGPPLPSPATGARSKRA